MAMPSEDEIARRVITQCVEPAVTECRFWRCQKANKCQKHDYVKSIGEIMDGLDAAPTAVNN